MRIALVGTRGVPARYGGFETCVEEVGSRLAARGHEVVVYCHRSADGAARPAEYLGMQLVWCPALRRKTLETLSSTAVAVAHLMRRPVDAAIVFNAANAPFLPFLRARRIPVATHVDGLEWRREKWQGVGRRYYRLAESMAVRWSDALIADARGIADYYREEFGADTVQIGYGAPIVTEPSDARIADLGLFAKKYHLIVARFEPENHVDLLVAGYRRSGAELPLVVVGSAPYADGYTRRIHELADDRVKFLGSVWDQELLDQLYANALTYLHGHSVGGTNPSLLRAMGAGASVIAYDVTFNWDVAGGAGRYVRNVEDVTSELERAEARPAETMARGVEAQEAAAGRFDWDEVAVAYEKLCIDLAAPARRPAPRCSGRRQTHTARAPRILIAHPSTEEYGSDRQMLQSVAALRGAATEVVVCVPDGGPLLGDRDLDGATVRVAPFPVLRKALLRPRALARLALSTPRDLHRLVRLIRDVDPSAVYVNTLTIPLWILAARLARRPVLVHVHEAEETLARPMRVALAAPLLLAHRVITNSAAARRLLVEAIPPLARTTQVVLNGVPDRGPAPPRSGTSPPWQLLLVGRLSPRKGTDVALEATAILRRQGQEVRLKLCGDAFAGYEWFEQQLRTRASAPDLAGAVEFAGFVPDTRPALAEADVVLVPSRAEPFGNTAVEAMYAERPVVASEVQGLAEIVADDRTGLLVPPSDPAALAAAIARLLTDPALRRRLALAGRVEAGARFTTRRYRHDICAALSEVVTS
ncbi:MAG TPA: glycosyltransferase [Jatrophihabitans sp.]|nr:glycosyltransferase [Jatrophihabitans sp.]